ncbi:Phosphoglycerol transferase MdoB [Fibrobacter sp. UWH9]|uniref:hypothetical protein n=1 Tax=Fibrobacter sp. UWH9 TaxID=1896213 RepID=UPI0009145B14|nr:hypothetical protein [Fibrobacter sp. UWH9]SHG32462.1 Phosphoglycerol transferase MdoB [Fibrobacter sp. UWH9]
MTRILYPLIATALITITPYLLTFEKGQDLTRGVLNFSIFALLLLFVHVRDTKVRWRRIMQVSITIAIVAVGLVDVQNIMRYKKVAFDWMFLVPFTTTALALAMLKNVKPIAMNMISLTLFLSLGVHIACSDVFPSQPIFETPLLNSLSLLQKTTPDRRILPDEIKNQINVIDSSFVTKAFIDTTKNNVVILVESWGVPMDSIMFKSELNMFKMDTIELGIHSRMYSKTRTAEREDLLYSLNKRADGSRDSVFLPTFLTDLGYSSFFFFGGDSTIQHRDRYISHLGFTDVHFTREFMSDSVLASHIDSVLCDSTQKYFIVWTTRDTQFPMGDSAEVVERLYFEKLFNTLKIISNLAEKHSETRFIVQGDHEPILSPQEFRQKFYRRWVPFVVLN